MKIAFYVLAAVASLLLIPAVGSAASGMPREQRLLVQVKHHGASRALPPVHSRFWTTPNLRTGSGSWRYYNYQNYGASPGQPGSPTYAPYAGLPPLRYHY